MKTELLYNSIALLHINKNAEMKADFNKVLAEKNLTVDKLLGMSANDFLKTEINTVMGSESIGFGKEWVEQVVLSSELISRLSDSESLLSMATRKTMNGATVSFPVEGKKIRMVGTVQNTVDPQNKDSVSVKQLGTPQIELSASEYIVTVYINDTLLEDSVIGIGEYAMKQILDAYETSVHEVILNGDTATGNSININIIDANTSTLPDGNRTDFLKTNGARKLAFTKSATVDAGGNLAIESIREARAKMGAKGLNPADLVLVPDQDSYFELMGLSEVETIEKFGSAATIVNGTLAAIDGIKILNREEMAKALATGKVSATPANNVKGQMLIIHKPSLLFGSRRDLTTELSRYAEERTTGITGSARFAVGFNDVQNNVRPTSPVALIINV